MIRRYKEERGTGLPYAVKDPESKNYILAEDAVSGEKYFCPDCGCKMHVTTSKLGKRYFARNSGEEHKKDKCAKYEDAGVWRTFDDLEPESFIRNLCMALLRRGGGVVSGPRARNGKDDAGTDDSEIKILPFANLRQIAGAMPGFLDGNTADGKHRISDFLISFRYAHDVIKGDHYELGARIVHCRYITHHDPSKSLMFKIFQRDQRTNQVDFEVRFRLAFPEDTLYQHYRNMLVEEGVSEGGRCQTCDKKKQDALIASDNWVFSGRPNCNRNCGMKKCGCCYGLYQAVIVTTDQIYLMKSED